MAITFTNSTGLTITAAASTWSIAPPVLIHGGQAFVLGLGPASSAVTVSTITDNTTNVYHRAVACPSPRPAAGAEIWYTTNLSSASTRISITLSGASSGSLGLAQFDGISTGNPLAGTASSGVTGNSTTFRGGDLTPERDNCVAVSFERLTFSTIGTITNLGGMTTWISTGVGGGTIPRTHGMYLIQGAASTVTGSFTTSSRGMGAGVIAAFSDTTPVALFSAPPSLMTWGFGV